MAYNTTLYLVKDAFKEFKSTAKRHQTQCTLAE